MPLTTSPSQGRVILERFRILRASIAYGPSYIKPRTGGISTHRRLLGRVGVLVSQESTRESTHETDRSSFRPTDKVDMLRSIGSICVFVHDLIDFQVVTVGGPTATVNTDHGPMIM